MIENIRYNKKLFPLIVRKIQKKSGINLFTY